MANIRTYLENILSSIYGKDVRQSIHDGIEKINEEVELNSEVELERVHQEQLRKQAEAERNNAELARVQAEGKREQTKAVMEEIITDMNNKIANDYYRGPQGIQGVGLGLTPKGGWNDYTTYVENDLVLHNLMYWRSKKENRNSEPNEANESWEVQWDLTESVTPIETKLKEKVDKSKSVIETYRDPESFPNPVITTDMYNINNIIKNMPNHSIFMDSIYGESQYHDENVLFPLSRTESGMIMISKIDLYIDIRITSYGTNAYNGKEYQGVYDLSSKSITNWMNVLKSSNIAHNLATTNPDMVLGADMGKQLNDALTTVENRLISEEIGAGWSTTELQNNQVKILPWANYETLTFSLGYYGNIYSTISVPSSYFATTSSSRRLVFERNTTTIEIYKNVAGDGVALSGTNIQANMQVHLYGTVKK